MVEARQKILREFARMQGESNGEISRFRLTRRLTVIVDSLLVSLNLNALTYQILHFSVFLFNVWRHFHYVSRPKEFSHLYSDLSIVGDIFHTQPESTGEYFVSYTDIVGVG